MKVVLPTFLADQLTNRVRAIAPGVEIIYFDQAGELSADADDAEVLLRWFNTAEQLADLIDRLPGLRWMHIPRAGVDTSLVRPVLERDIILTNSSGVHAIPIAEFVLLFMLNHAKQVPSLLKAQAEHEWVKGDQLQLQELEDKTALIIGLGQIGQAIASRARAFGMRVLGSSRSGRAVPGVEQVVGEGDWRELLPEADYVIIAAPLTPTTRGMFGAAELASMQPSSYLINIARGEIVDEQALLAAVRAKVIAGAALDVFATEPLPSDSPLWNEPNIFVTPHISWNSPHIRQRTLNIFLENLRHFVAGEPLINVVDKQAGY